jgi:GYF domain 2
MEETWWYRTLGEEFGPVSFQTIEQLLGSGVLDDRDEVRNGRAGEWQPIRLLLASNFAIATVRYGKVKPADPKADIGADARDCDPSTAQKPHSDEIARATAEYLKALRDRRAKPPQSRFAAPRLATPAAGTAILKQILAFAQGIVSCIGTVCSMLTARIGRKTTCAAIAAVTFMCGTLAIRHFWVSKTSVYFALNEQLNQLRDLRSRNADVQEWERYAAQSRAIGEELSAKLKRIAGPDDPAAMEMLWAARDYLPKLAQDSREEKGVSEERFELHMARADTFLWGDPHRRRRGSTNTSSIDWMTFSIVTVDVVLAVGAGVWFLLRRAHLRT